MGLINKMHDVINGMIGKESDGNEAFMYEYVRKWSSLLKDYKEYGKDSLI